MQDENVSQNSDEISLIDIFLLIWRRKFLVLGVFVICVSAGIGYALLAPEVYEFKTVMEVGTTLKNLEKGDPVVIEEPTAVLEKLKASYIPVELHAFAARTEAKMGKPVIQASAPKNSNLIILKSKALRELDVEYQRLHQVVVNAVMVDHQRVLAATQRELAARVSEEEVTLEELQNPKLVKMRKGLLQDELKSKKRALKTVLDRQKIDLLKSKATVAAEKAKLDDLKDQTKQVDVQLELLEKERQLVERQAGEVGVALSGIKTGRKLAAAGVDDATKALTLMMVENQVEMQRTRLERLETRLTIDIKRQHGALTIKKAEILRDQGVQHRILAAAETALDKLVADAQREIEALREQIAVAESGLVKFDIDLETKVNRQVQVIEQLQGRFDVLRNTEALSVALRSLERVEPKRASIVGVSGVLGVMLGIFSAFFASLVGQIKIRQTQMDVGS